MVSNQSPNASAAPDASADRPAAIRSRRARAIEQTSLLVPLIGMGLGTWALLRGEPKTRSIGLAALVASVSAGLTRWQMARWVTETSRHALPDE